MVISKTDDELPYLKYHNRNDGSQIIELEKVKDVECEEESKDVSNSGFSTDNESISESEMSTF